MAFNCADTRQRAYNRIDTSNPQGNWVDERSYNRPDNALRGRTLVGNWQEEVHLEADMNDNGHDVSLLRQRGRYMTGGFESTAYLLSPEEQGNRLADTVTTNRHSFNDTNGDVAMQRKPKLGVRSELRAQMVIAEAEKLAADAAQAPAEPLSTTYRATLSDRSKEQPRTIDMQQTLEQSKKLSTPITLYSGNPQSGVKMAVQGASSAAGTGNPHGKNCSFTFEKYSL
jgi:hypothetical protein